MDRKMSGHHPRVDRASIEMLPNRCRVALAVAAIGNRVGGRYRLEQRCGAGGVLRASYECGGKGNLSSSVPGLFAWPVIACATTVLAARLVVTRDTVAHRRANGALLWWVIGLLFYRCTPVLDLANPMNQLALGSTVMVAMYLFGLGRVWDFTGDPSVLRSRQRRYCGVAVLATIVIVLAGPAAARAGRLTEHHLNWAGIAVWAAFALPQLATVWALSRVSIRELRGRVGLRARAVCWLIVLACQAFYVDLALSAGPFFGLFDVPPYIVRAEIIFTSVAFVTTMLQVIPLGGRFMARTGLDRDGRICRRLYPLWRDVTAAVPEVVLSPNTALSTRHDSTARLLRMVVEIRDALLHLGPYLPPSDTPNDLRGYAHRIAAAIHARSHRLPPAEDGATAQSPGGAKDFDTELRYLLDLARVWPRRGTRDADLPAMQ